MPLFMTLSQTATRELCLGPGNTPVLSLSPFCNVCKSVAAGLIVIGTGAT